MNSADERNAQLDSIIHRLILEQLVPDWEPSGSVTSPQKNRSPALLLSKTGHLPQIARTLGETTDLPSSPFFPLLQLMRPPRKNSPSANSKTIALKGTQQKSVLAIPEAHRREVHHIHKGDRSGRLGSGKGPIPGDPVRSGCGWRAFGVVQGLVNGRFFKL